MSPPHEAPRMKFIEPAFDPAEASWQTMPGATQDDVSDLQDRLAKQSKKLYLRINEILELYNIQSRQEEALQIAGEEIVRLKQTISGLQEFATRQKEEAIAIKDKVVRLESEKSGPALAARTDTSEVKSIGRADGCGAGRIRCERSKRSLCS